MIKNLKLASIYIFSFAYIYAGIMHFVNPDFFLSIMPNYFTLHLFLVHLTGLAEIIFGLLLILKKSRRVASYGLIILLICVFPANIYLVESELSQYLLNVNKSQTIIRLPFQGLLILIAYWHSKNI